MTHCTHAARVPRRRWGAGALLASASLLLLLLLPRPAAAALPIGFDLAAGAGGSGSFDERVAAFDLHVRAELRLGVFTLGASLKERPPLPNITPANALLIYGDLGLNIPLPKGRIALRAGVGGGDIDGPVIGLHETVGLHLFAVPVIGIGFEADFEQTWLLEKERWSRGVGGRLLLLVRL